MITYSFSVVRYVHDVMSGEFVNVGVAVYSADAWFLKARCTNHYGRINRVFDRIDGDRFKQLMRHTEMVPDQENISTVPRIDRRYSVVTDQFGCQFGGRA